VPKPTFSNLPAPKRDALVEVALAEFAEHSYHRASLSRIVERAGIAKGSVYQYFEDKLDLYRWLLTEEVPRRRLAASPLRSGAATLDLAGLLRELVGSGVRFLLDNPVLAGFVAPVTQPTSDPQLRELYRHVRQSGHTRFVALLTDLRDRGELRDDLDLDLVSRVIGLVLGSGLPELILGPAGFGLEDLVSHPEVARQLEAEVIDGIVEDAIRVLLEGIAPRGR